MSSQMSLLFEDDFEVISIDEGGKKFDKVSRCRARGITYDMELEFDYACHIYKISKNDQLRVVLAPTLNKDFTPDTDEYKPAGNASSSSSSSTVGSLADDYSYVMHGKCFKIQTSGKDHSRLEVYISFGGLLLSLKGLGEYMDKIKMDQRIYLLVRKEGEETKPGTNENEDDV